MKRKFTLLAIILLLWLPAIRSQQPMDAVGMNDLLVKIVDELSESGATWFARFDEVSLTYEFYDLIPIREELVALINQKMDLLNSLEDVEGSEEFRLAESDFLIYEEKFVLECFVPFESLDEYTTQEEFDSLASNFETWRLEEVRLMDELRQLQYDYALLNDIELIDDTE
jgi:hypothetical protein